MFFSILNMVLRAVFRLAPAGNHRDREVETDSSRLQRRASCPRIVVAMVAQHADLLGFALMTNALSLHRHRLRKRAEAAA